MFLLWRRSRAPVLLFGSTICLITYGNARPLWNDGGRGKPPWPDSRPLVSARPAEGREPGEDKKSNDNNCESTVESKDDDVPLFEDDDSAAWANFSSRFTTARKSISSIHWPTVGNAIADKILPDWAQMLPDYITKLQREIAMGSDSLAGEIWQDAQDPDLHPMIDKPARVRISKDLCDDELAFIARRKRYTTQALAKYLIIAEEEVDPEDVPTIALCGSGGGLRALVAGASSCLSAQEAGLFDCATFTAGVSGSCWLQVLYNSTLAGRRHDKVIQHLKSRIGVHIAYPPSFLELLTRAPTNKYLLSGTIEKLKGDPNAVFGVVDAYGLLLAARLLVPKHELAVDDSDLKLSNQRSYLARGQNPLPIYCAVRHEIPVEEQKSKQNETKRKITDEVKEKAKQEAWFQWLEFTPYELWCEELEAGIPSWSIGRRFSKGQSVMNKDGHGLPELGIPFMMGIWGSAFCATLAHYYKEVRPVLKGLAGFGNLDDLLEEKNDELIKVHPIDPGAIPNYALGLQGLLPPTTPSSIFKDEYLELMDAGMSNNLPIYPLLRRGRNVDIMVCFDASADIKQENWLSVADGYAKQRGIKGWPVGVGWPKEKDESKKELDAADAATAQQAAGKIAEAREKQREEAQKGNQKPSSQGTEKTDDSDGESNQSDTDLTYCNVWVGTTVERTSDSEPPQSKITHPDQDWKIMAPDAGTTVIYFPLLPNPSVPGVDPASSDFLSTWNFIYTPEEIEKVVSLARANFAAGKEQVRAVVRAVYERKKRERVERERRAERRRWRGRLRGAGNHFL
ncbi:hypothetical protein MMC21_006184 [Puttea exsequens]|nr:hypothetical protein [Puttea exsequens]